jgi:NNP family nitrate/nitrite transporter-like MFS transporter
MPLFGALGGSALTWTRGTQTASLWIQNAAFIWVVPVLFFTIAAAVGLRSIPVKASFAQQAVIFRRKHNWVMTSLYVMTFGTFSGMSAVFALLIREVFGRIEGAPDPLQYAFLGALIGSVTRPPGGWISDKIGGARVTMVCGVLLLLGSIGVTWFTAPTSVETFTPFLGLILLIFFAAGIGNGSTFRMIPVIFPRQEAGPVLGWTAAIAAYGSFVLPMLFNWSLARFGSVNQAFYVMAVFYVCNLALCWWFYARKGAEAPC